MEILQLLLEKQYSPYLPAYSTHILRPLDVVLFRCHCHCYIDELMIWVRKGGNAIKKGQYYKFTCYITLYSTLMLSSRPVPHAAAAAYTKSNMLCFFEAAGIWDHNARKEFFRQSQNFTWLESLPITPTPLLCATPRWPRAVSRLAHGALHIVTCQSPFPFKLKAHIAQPETLTKCKLAQKTYANLPDTPVAHTRTSKYLWMLQIPPGALQGGFRLCKRILRSSSKHLKLWRFIQDAMRDDDYNGQVLERL